MNSARHSAPRDRGDVSDACAYVAGEPCVVAIARTEGMTRRWIVTARRDDVTGRSRELPPNTYDLTDSVCEVSSIEDVMRSRLLMQRAGIGHADGGVRAEITVRGVSTYIPPPIAKWVHSAAKVYKCAIVRNFLMTVS